MSRAGRCGHEVPEPAGAAALPSWRETGGAVAPGTRKEPRRGLAGGALARVAGWDNEAPRKEAALPYEPILTGSLVVCVRCRDGDPGRSPVFPSWFMPRHEAWHDGHPQLVAPPVDAPSRVLLLPA